MFPTNHLYRVPFYSQARSPCGNPVIIVPNENEVTIARRVMLRASIGNAFAIVNLGYLPIARHCGLLRSEGTNDHNLVMSRTKWLEEVSSLIGHSSAILYFHLEECTRAANS
jgi:hypothetical protein